MTNDRYLFRGFNKDENGKETIYLNGEEIKGKWVYGYYVKVENYYTKGASFNKALGEYIIASNNELIEVIPSTISQYTGLDDNKGNKIFEKDMIEEGCNGLISSVVYDNEIGTYKLKDLGDYYIKDAPIEWEIIGTIFDSKEVK